MERGMARKASRVNLEPGFPTLNPKRPTYFSGKIANNKTKQPV